MLLYKYLFFKKLVKKLILVLITFILIINKNKKIILKVNIKFKF